MTKKNDAGNTVERPQTEARPSWVLKVGATQMELLSNVTLTGLGEWLEAGVLCGRLMQDWGDLG